MGTQYGILTAEVSPLEIKLAEQRKRVRAMKLAHLQGLDWRNLNRDNTPEKITLEATNGIN